MLDGTSGTRRIQSLSQVPDQTILSQIHQFPPYSGWIFFFPFWLTPLHGDSCWQGLVVCAYRRQSCQVSHLCQGAMKRKENLAWYYCATTGHNCTTVTATLCLCCSPGSTENRVWKDLQDHPAQLTEPTRDQVYLCYSWHVGQGSSKGSFCEIGSSWTPHLQKCVLLPYCRTP